MNRKNKNNIFLFISYCAAGLCSIVLLFLLCSIFMKGFSAINLTFLLGESKNFGLEGGIFYQILGSLILVGGAALISFPIALGAAIFTSEFIKNKTIRRFVHVFILGLNGIPSIIFGIFGLLFFINYLGMSVSWLVGSIILGMMILPTIMISAYQSMNSIPHNFREAAYGLGLNKWQVITSVLIPQSIQGSFTGLLLGLARAIGETAPILFVATAFSGICFPSSVSDPVVTLPTHILHLAQQATNPKTLENAWGACLVLIVLVFLFSSGALIMRVRYSKIVVR
jgi:phosphate transport system permease protein